MATMADMFLDLVVNWPISWSCDLVGLFSVTVYKNCFCNIDLLVVCATVTTLSRCIYLLTYGFVSKFERISCLYHVTLTFAFLELLTHACQTFMSPLGFVAVSC